MLDATVHQIQKTWRQSLVQGANCTFSHTDERYEKSKDLTLTFKLSMQMMIMLHALIPQKMASVILHFIDCSRHLWCCFWEKNDQHIFLYGDHQKVRFGLITVLYNIKSYWGLKEIHDFSRLNSQRTTLQHLCTARTSTNLCSALKSTGGNILKLKSWQPALHTAYK